MNIQKQERQTRLIEMVETHNLSISLRRLDSAPIYTSLRWKRALYHALAMSNITGISELEKIRQAIGLP